MKVRHRGGRSPKLCRGRTRVPEIDAEDVLLPRGVVGSTLDNALGSPARVARAHGRRRADQSGDALSLFPLRAGGPDPRGVDAQRAQHGVDVLGGAHELPVVKVSPRVEGRDTLIRERRPRAGSNPRQHEGAMEKTDGSPCSAPRSTCKSPPAGSTIFEGVA